MKLFLLMVLASQYPVQIGFVTDAAAILDVDDVQRLNTELSRYEAESTNEIAIVTVPSLEGQTIENYTSALWLRWGVGKKGKDNGVIVVIAPNERLLRVQRGIGLRDTLTNQEASRIVQDVMAPRFKINDRAGALFAGVSAIEKTLMKASVTDHKIQQPTVITTRAVKQPLVVKEETNSKTDLFLVVISLIALVVLVMLALRWKSNENERLIREKRRERAEIDAELEKEKFKSPSTSAAAQKSTKPSKPYYPPSTAFSHNRYAPAPSPTVVVIEHSTYPAAQPTSYSPPPVIYSPHTSPASSYESPAPSSPTPSYDSGSSSSYSSGSSDGGGSSGGFDSGSGGSSDGGGGSGSF